MLYRPVQIKLFVQECSLTLTVVKQFLKIQKYFFAKTNLIIILNKIDKFENLFNHQWKNKIQQNASNPNKYYLKDFQLVWFVLQEMPPTKIFPIFLKSEEIESINNILQNLFSKITFLRWAKWSFGQKTHFLNNFFFCKKSQNFFYLRQNRYIGKCCNFDIWRIKLAKDNCRR